MEATQVPALRLGPHPTRAPPLVADLQVAVREAIPQVPARLTLAAVATDLAHPIPAEVQALRVRHLQP